MRVIRPVSSQFYNYISHRVAAHAGRFDAQQETVTAALAGAFALTESDKIKANDKQDYCKDALPSDRFRLKIDCEDCPTCLRAELVYSVDVRSLRSRSGRYTTLFIHRIWLYTPYVGLYLKTSFSLFPEPGAGKIYKTPSKITWSSSNQRFVIIT